MKQSADAFVDIYGTQNGKQILRAKCTLMEDGTVRCIGEAEFVRRLQQLGVTVSVPGQKERATFYPKDGMAFLHALEQKYDSVYTHATAVRHKEAVSS